MRKLRLLEATGSERLVGTREQNACVTLATTNEKKQDPGEGETPGNAGGQAAVCWSAVLWVRFTWTWRLSDVGEPFSPWL